MVKISWNTEKGCWGTWDTGLCTWGGNAAGVGGVLSALLCRIMSFPCSHFSLSVFDHLAVYLWSVFLSQGLNVVRNLLMTKAHSMHVTALVMYPEHLRKANRIWQKTGWNWKCSNLLKSTGRGSNSWPQLVNKPNVFTEQHRRWKSCYNKYIYITGHFKKNLRLKEILRQ